MLFGLFSDDPHRHWPLKFLRVPSVLLHTGIGMAWEWVTAQNRRRKRKGIVITSTHRTVLPRIELCGLFVLPGLCCISRFSARIRGTLQGTGTKVVLPGTGTRYRYYFSSKEYRYNEYRYNTCRVYSCTTFFDDFIYIFLSKIK